MSTKLTRAATDADGFLFDDTSTNVHSKVFTVGFGEVVVLSAFGLAYRKDLKENEPKNLPQRFIIQKVAFAGGGIYSRSQQENCASNTPLNIEPHSAFIEDVTTGCGPWCLTACRNTGIIVVPGSYRVELNDAGALGTALLALYTHDQASVRHLPANILFGV